MEYDVRGTAEKVRCDKTMGNLDYCAKQCRFYLVQEGEPQTVITAIKAVLLEISEKNGRKGGGGER